MKIKGKKYSPETRVIHDGEIKDMNLGSIHTPIYNSSVFYYPNKNAKIMDKSRELPFIYSRLGNPTVQSLEYKYASIENAEDSLAFSSGMAAITTVLLSFLKSGDRMLALSGLYGQTLDMLRNDMQSLGIKVDFIGIDDLNNLNFEAKKYKLIFMESIINPTLEVVDLKKIGKEIVGPLKVVDASMASPVNQNPLNYGIDIVIHSATKYISGHDDIVGGLVAGSKENMKIAANKRKALGTIIDPLSASTLLKNMKTMYLRINKQNENALYLANELNKMGYKVNYPGLRRKYLKIARENLKGFGGVLSFDLNVPYDKAEEFMDTLAIIKKAPTFGGVESLITMPWETSHTYIPEEQRLKLGITPSLLRLSVGIENPADLLNDLKITINKIKKE